MNCVCLVTWSRAILIDSHGLYLPCQDEPVVPEQTEEKAVRSEATDRKRKTEMTAEERKVLLIKVWRPLNWSPMCFVLHTSLISTGSARGGEDEEKET
jgi:hypothetical protein